MIMKVILDVCAPVHVRQALPGDDVHTAVRMGWRELENGEFDGVYPTTTREK